MGKPSTTSMSSCWVCTLTLRVNVAHVGANGSFGNGERLLDIHGVAPLGKKEQYLGLPLRKQVEVGRMLAALLEGFAAQFDLRASPSFPSSAKSATTILLICFSLTMQRMPHASTTGLQRRRAAGGTSGAHAAMHRAETAMPMANVPMNDP